MLLSYAVRPQVNSYYQCCEKCPPDIKVRSIEKGNRAHAINTVGVSRFRGWTFQSPHFWAGYVFTVQQGLSHFKSPTKCN